MDPDGLRDRNHRYGYLVARENARRIAEDPSVLEAGRRHLDRFSRDDPHQRDGTALWSALLAAGAAAGAVAEGGAVAARRPVLRDTRRMTGKARTLRKAAIAHLIRAAAAVSGRDTFVIVGTGALIAQLKTVPLDLMDTREIDIYVPNDPEADDISDLIDGTIGEGSPLDATFGYYAHGVGERTACLPEDWETRAVRYEVPNLPDVVCLCPEVNDIALSTLCAWREKDRTWLEAGLITGVLNLDAMEARGRSVSNPNAPDGDEIVRRLALLRASLRRD